jgi:Helix-turn-helix.|nr:helix-turn-helix transcriptional regulator [uncultured Steroidobacter sp.]
MATPSVTDRRPTHMGGRSVNSPFVRAINRALAEALVVEIRRCRLRRQDVADASGISRAYLQHLLAAQVNPSIGSLILIAKGLGMRPEQLLGKTMENLDRIRASEPRPDEPPP